MFQVCVDIYGVFNYQTRHQYTIFAMDAQTMTAMMPKPEKSRASANVYSFYAPSLPNSWVQSAFLSKSALLTVGLEALIALMKSLTRSGGSNS